MRKMLMKLALYNLALIQILFSVSDHLRGVRHHNLKIIRKDFQEKSLSEDCRRTLMRVLNLLVVVVVAFTVVVAVVKL